VTLGWATGYTVAFSKTASATMSFASLGQIDQITRTHPTLS
jgi:hypothetical protein